MNPMIEAGILENPQVDYSVACHYGLGFLVSDAYINDGLLDIMVILAFPLVAAGQVIQEVLNLSISGDYVKRFCSTWVEAWPDQVGSVNFDGEPYKARHIRFDVLPEKIQLVIPDKCPCLIK